ncbi:hypothetical protein [Microbispora bryophytorum]|uniref:hypothetical protein n=1 Tax=Microbispora bryophytorum TaxID=1460882 RepID=UPI003F4CDB19
MFEDADSAEARAEYIQALGKTPMLAEYTYVKGNVVVRVDKDMAPSDAKAYEDALNEAAGRAGRTAQQVVLAGQELLGQVAADDEALDLVGALEDLHDPRCIDSPPVAFPLSAVCSGEILTIPDRHLPSLATLGQN